MMRIGASPASIDDSSGVGRGKRLQSICIQKRILSFLLIEVYQTDTVRSLLLGDTAKKRDQQQADQIKTLRCVVQESSCYQVSGS